MTDESPEVPPPVFGVMDEDYRVELRTEARGGSWVEWFPDTYRDWIVAFRVRSDSGAGVVSEVRVFPRAEGEVPFFNSRPIGQPHAYLAVPVGGVPSRLLRSITMARAMDLFREVFVGPPAVDEGVEVMEGGEWRDAPELHDLHTRVLTHLEKIGLGASSFKPAPRPGRTGHTDTYYAQIAALYADRVARRVTSPHKDIAKHLHVTPEYVRDLVHDARKRGMLTPAARGRAAGELTQKAMDLLNEEDARE